jgi:hypothetical protein
MTPGERRVRVLAAPLRAALEQAAAAARAELEPALAEQWQLPAGSHELGAEALELELEGRELFLVGQGGSELLAPGGLSLDASVLGFEGLAIALDGARLTLTAASAVELSRVRVVGGGVAATAPRVSVRGLDLSATAAAIALDLHGDSVELASSSIQLVPVAAGAQTGARVTATSVLSVTDCVVSGAAGAPALGLAAAAPHVRLAGVRVLEVTEAEGASGDGALAVGIEVLAAEGAELTALRVESVAGTRAIGLRLAVGDEVVSGALGGATLVDLAARGIEASESADGIVAAAAGPLLVRGVTIEALHGERATGLTLLGGAEIELGVAEVRDVFGIAGQCAGVRVIAGAPRGAVLVRDVSVDGVGAFVSGDPGGVPLASEPAIVPGLAWDDVAAAALLVLRERARQLAADAASARAGEGWRPVPRPLASLPELPALPSELAEPHEIVGLHLAAFADEPPFLGDEPPPAPIQVRGCVLRRVAGAALAVVGGLRPVELTRSELWSALSPGYVQGEEVLCAELTLHRHATGLRVGSGAFSIYDSLISSIGSGPSLRLEDGAEREAAAALFTTSQDAAEDTHAQPLAPLPYRSPGPLDIPAGLAAGEVPLDAAVDLRLVPTAAIASAAVPFPSAEPEPPFVGAHEPERTPRCEARDPEPWSQPPAPPRPEPAPIVNYLARDAASLLDVMLERARVSMPSWTEQGPADLVRLLFELLAHRLDVEAYCQEQALAEGFLDTARSRRSVEDHACALDYEPDPGLSATAMLRFELQGVEDVAPALLDPDGSVLVPAETLVGIEASAEASVVFASEAPLRLWPALDRLALAEPAAVGATHAWLVNEPGLERLDLGRWLVFERGAHEPGHVVRITGIERGPEATRIAWDPRRPLPFFLPERPAGDSSPGPVRGNVVPAHHGVPLARLEPEEAASDAPLGRWRRLLSFRVDPAQGRDVPLPLGPLSVQAPGYPLPNEEKSRRGQPRLRVQVEGDVWERVERLALAGPSDEVYALRSGDDEREVLRFGDGSSGSALPGRSVSLALDVCIGRGRIGNVAAGRLTRLIQLGPASAGDTPLEQRLGAAEGPEREDRLRQVLRVDNPLPAVGGRDPEPLARIRYRAPFGVRDARSAITLADYERLLLELPEVSAARARVRGRGLRPVVRATVLLADEALLEPAERVRRWALVRRRMEEIRLLGHDVEVAPPVFVPLDLDLVVDAAAHADASGVQDAVTAVLAGEGGLFDPDRIRLGGDVHLSALYQTVLTVPGVSALRVKRFQRLAPDALDRLAEGVIPIGAEEVASLAPNEGLLSVTVCGGLR